MTTDTTNARPYRIDGLLYCKWSDSIFRQMREAGLDAVHATICYHEGLRETIANISAWNRWFELYPDLIMKGRTASDIDQARASGRTAVFFGFQNCAPIEDDIGLVEVVYDLGCRFMQLTYNNQSLLGTGCYEADDAGITRMGREVIEEMNRVGLVIDLSHSAERTTLAAIDLSARPIAITHANPASWHNVPRNKSDTVLKALAARGGILGFSLYAHHLAGGSHCTLRDFCTMAARTADLIGVDHIAIGSDLCQDQPDSVVEWMRAGRWTKSVETGSGPLGKAVFPPPPSWFGRVSDFPGIAAGLLAAGFTPAEAGQVMGGNWYRFFAESFAPQADQGDRH